MSSDNATVEPARLRDAFPGGELTPARAAKLMACSVAEVEALIAEGKLLARTGPKPGGGEHVLVAFESVQAMRAEDASPSAPTSRPSPLPDADVAELARRPRQLAAAATARTAPSEEHTPPAGRNDGRTDSLADALERLTAMHTQLLEKLDGLLDVLREQGRG